MESLECRLSTLEQRIFGSGASPTSPTSPALAAQLHDFSRHLGEALHPRDRIAPLLRRTKELESYLQPPLEQIDQGLDTDTKTDIILAQEERVRETADLLSRLNDAKKVLDSQALTTTVGELKPRLAELTRLQLEQAEREQGVSDETLNLVGQYNDIVDTLDKSFVHFDRVLRAAEKKKKEEETGKKK